MDEDEAKFHDEIRDAYCSRMACYIPIEDDEYRCELRKDCNFYKSTLMKIVKGDTKDQYLSGKVNE